MNRHDYRELVYKLSHLHHMLDEFVEERGFDEDVKADIFDFAMDFGWEYLQIYLKKFADSEENQK